MKYTKITAGITLLVAGFGLGFGVGRQSHPEQFSKPNDFGWFEISSFSYSPDLPDAEVDRRVTSMCEGAIEAHRNTGFARGAEDIHSTLFARLDQLPPHVIERNKTTVLGVVEEMLRSPYHQNVLHAQKYVMRHLEAEWMSNFARSYVKRFDDIDYAFGSSIHHLKYFLRGAAEIGGSSGRNADGSTYVTPDTKAYAEFAEFVVNHAEELSERKAGINEREIHDFVKNRKSLDQLAK